MNRKDAIKFILKKWVKKNTIIVSSLGMISRELYTIKDRKLNFYMLGAMGNSLSVGLGMALNCNRKVVVLSGDGDTLMSLGTLIMHKKLNPPNLFHYILDNNCHASTGGQKTCSDAVDFGKLAPNTKVIKVSNEKGSSPRIPLSCKEIKKRFIVAL